MTAGQDLDGGLQGAGQEKQGAHVAEASVREWWSHEEHQDATLSLGVVIVLAL